MNLLQDIITYVRRIVKTPSNEDLSDNLIIDYINRFWINDVDARIQLFDLKTKYQFLTVPGFDQYNMPMYDLQIEGEGNDVQQISYYPVYQGFSDPVFINGVQVPFYTNKSIFFGVWPNIVQQMNIVAVGDGGATYNFTFPISPNNPNPITTPYEYILRGHVDINGIIAYATDTGSYVDPPLVTTLNTSIPVANTFASVYLTSNGADGSSIVVSDSGQFLLGNQNYGLLMNPGKNPVGNTSLGNYISSFVITGITQATQAVLTSTTSLQVGQKVSISGVVGMTELNGNTYTISAVTPTTVTLNVNSTSFTAYVSGGLINAFTNVVNYFTGEVNVTFPQNIPVGVNINAQCYLFATGLPRGVLFTNNTIILRSPPSQQFLVEMDAYLTPAGFLATNNSIPFAYMSEYIARGAARKLLSDTGDIEQFMFYEPLFKEQEMLVWKRSQRQFTTTRTETIYSLGNNRGYVGNNANLGF